MRLRTATTHMKDSCTTSNMNIHEVRDENGETMRAGVVFALSVVELG